MASIGVWSMLAIFSNLNLSISFDSFFVIFRFSNLTDKLVEGLDCFTMLLCFNFFLVRLRREADRYFAEIDTGMLML